MTIIYPDKHPSRDLHQLILGTIIPRPIALVSTISETGIFNLAPFSYFNAISSVPPILGFSVSDRKNGLPKDTIANISQNKECVINLVSYDISRKMSLAGIDFPPDIDEYAKCGFTPVDSDLVKPPGIKESPVRFECKIEKILNFGIEGSKTSFVVCNVICIHFDEKILNADNRIDPDSTGIIGRLGGTNYIKINNDNIFSIPQSRTVIPLGYDRLPEKILKSKILTGNEIAAIAGLEALPDDNYILEIGNKYKEIKNFENSFYKLVSDLIKSGKIEEAAALLLSNL